MTKKQLRVIIGENIRNERVTRNISIDELAEMLELTSGFVGLIERGQRGTTPSTLLKLADVFGMSIDTLFSDENGSLNLGEEHLPRGHAKRLKIESLISGFSEKELDFVIDMIKNLRALTRGGLLGENLDEDEEV